MWLLIASLLTDECSIGLNLARQFGDHIHVVTVVNVRLN
jgi:hypothetical protein